MGNNIKVIEFTSHPVTREYLDLGPGPISAMYTAMKGIIVDP